LLLSPLAFGYAREHGIVSWAAIGNRAEMACRSIARGGRKPSRQERDDAAVARGFSRFRRPGDHLPAARLRSARTKEGLTALDLACEYNHAHLLASLKRQTAAE